MRLHSTFFTVAAFLGSAPFTASKSTRGGAQRSFIPATTSATASTTNSAIGTDESSSRVPSSSSSSSSTADQRINDYVTKYRQRFFVVDQTVHHEAVVEFGDPHEAPQQVQESVTVSSSRVYWVCKPQHEPNRMFPNSGGQQQHHHYNDNVVAHGLVYSMDTGLVSPYGYVAARAVEGDKNSDTYDEFFLGYDDHSIQQIKLDDGTKGDSGLSIVGSGTTYGGRLTSSSSGRGEWVTDVEDPRLVAMSQVLGIALTPENCDNFYNRAWDKAHMSIIGAGESN